MRLVYFSPVPAGSYAQRPHFMVRAWLDWGAESVLWVNPYPCRLPEWQDFRRKAGLHDQGTPLDPRVSAIDVRSLPVEPLPLGTWLNGRFSWRGVWREIERFAMTETLVVGVGRPCAMALMAIRRLIPAASFYDAMDNFPEFYRGLSRWAMRRHEDAIADEVDLVVASSTFLADKFARRGLRVEKILNACEIKAEGGGRRAEELLASGEWRVASEGTDRATGIRAENTVVSGQWSVVSGRGVRREERGVGKLESPKLVDAENPPSALRLPPSSNLQSPIPVLGYIGCIGRWFDWPLVLRLAEALPGAKIELIGPCVVPPPARLPANVRMLPACKQSETAELLSRFSAGLIPFQSNALTAGVDPIKYYEYRAAGLPVLSTRFGEMALRGRGDGVHFLDDSVGLAEIISAALVNRGDRAAAARFSRENNWDYRFGQSEKLQSLLPASRMRRAA